MQTLQIHYHSLHPPPPLPVTTVVVHIPESRIHLLRQVCIYSPLLQQTYLTPMGKQVCSEHDGQYHSGQYFTPNAQCIHTSMRLHIHVVLGAWQRWQCVILSPVQCKFGTRGKRKMLKEQMQSHQQHHLAPPIITSHLQELYCHPMC